MSEERELTPEKKKELEEFNQEIEREKERLTGKKRQSFDANSKEDMEKAKLIAEKQIQKIEEKDEATELLEDVKMKAVLEWQKKTGELLEPNEISLAEAKRLIKATRLEKEPQEPSGSAPLEGQYGKSQSNDLFKRTWNSHKEMIDFLHKMERNKDNPEGVKLASRILEKLVENAFELRKEPKAPSGEIKEKMPTIEELTTKKKRSENQVGLEYT